MSLFNLKLLWQLLWKNTTFHSNIWSHGWHIRTRQWNRERNWSFKYLLSSKLWKICKFLKILLNFSPRALSSGTQSQWYFFTDFFTIFVIEMDFLMFWLAQFGQAKFTLQLCYLVTQPDQFLVDTFPNWPVT